MNQKDFKLLISNISIIIKPINQLLYESIILIIFYYIFNSISFININNNNQSNNNQSNNNQSNNTQSNHKKFIYLIFIICIILDWFIWNNYIQTFLFISILYLYIIYNFNKSNTISTFINVMNNSKSINKANTEYEIDLNNNKLYENNNERLEQEKINMITFVPKDIIINNNPEPYQKNLEGINEINSAFSSSIPSIRITDSKFADDQLINLYDTPQYKNSENAKKSDESDESDESDKSHELSNTNNLNLFKNPKREFLDNKWLTLKENTYNDNCKNCKSGNNNNNNNQQQNNQNNKNKNAICSVVKYGQELEECTNQVNKVNYNQLDKISTNAVTPIYKM
jgi:hypothetical protein